MPTLDPGADWNFSSCRSQAWHCVDASKVKLAAFQSSSWVWAEAPALMQDKACARGIRPPDLPSFLPLSTGAFGTGGHPGDHELLGSQLTR